MNIDRYMELFVGRTDVFAQQQSNGAYYPVKAPITKDDVAEHLAGFASYGTYVISPAAGMYGEQTVPYVVFDLDTYDEAALEHLKWCVKYVVDDVRPDNDPDYKSLVLESSGGKGYHIWLLLSEPLPAVQVRRWLGWAFWPLWLEAAAAQPDWPALEVFPKQDAVDEGGFGNLVKLPLGVHAKTGNKSEFVPVTDWASGVNEVVPLDASLVPALEASDLRGTPAEPRVSGATPFPCINRILSGDVPQGTRDRAMFHLAIQYYSWGIDQELALEQCRRVNATFPRPLTDSEVATKVRSAYTGRHRAGCGAEWLRDFCPGPCPKWAKAARPAETPLVWLNEGDAIEVQVAGLDKQADRVRVTLTHPQAMNRPTLILSRERT